MRCKHNGRLVFKDLGSDFVEFARGKIWNCLLLFAISNSSLYDDRLTCSEFADFDNVGPTI